MKVNENPQLTASNTPAYLQQELAAHARKVNRIDRVYYQLSCSDLTTALSAATSVAYFRALGRFDIKEARASLLTASSSGAVTVDINLNGSTILSTKLTVDANEKTSVTAATPCVLTSYQVQDDDEITIDIDGAGTGAKGLIVSIVGELP